MKAKITYTTWSLEFIQTIKKTKWLKLYPCKQIYYVTGCLKYSNILVTALEGKDFSIYTEFSLTNLSTCGCGHWPTVMKLLFLDLAFVGRNRLKCWCREELTWGSQSELSYCV